MSKYLLQRREPAQIAYHWINFASILVLASTGLAIYFGAGSTASLFGWHLWAAWILIAALIFHVWYSTLAWKRFDRMWLSRAELRQAARRLTNPGTAVKHRHYKVEQILFHWFIALDVIGLILTGLILWKPGRMLVGPFWLPWGWDAIYAARLLHDLFTLMLVGAVMAHVYFALCVPKNWLLLKSMFTGTVPLDEYAKEHRLSPSVEARVETEREDAGTVRSAPSSGGIA
jgi:cytochrome b subunit of formate dehydrogenase